MGCELSIGPINRRLRWYLVSNFLGYCGQQAYLFLAFWLSYEITGSNRAVATLVLAGGVASLVSAPLAGVLVDRVTDISKLVRVCQLVTAAVIAWLGFQIAVGLEFWNLLVAAALKGLVFSVMNAGRQAMLSAYASAEAVTRATGITRSSFYFARLVLPAIAGWLIAAYGDDGANLLPAEYMSYTISAFYVLASIALICAGPARYNKQVISEKIGRTIYDGLAYVMKTARVRLLLAVNFIFGILSVVFHVLVAGFVIGHMQAGPEHLGLVMSAAGLGALGGSAIAALSPETNRGGGLLLGAVIAGVSLALVTIQNNIWMAIALTTVFGFGQGIRITLTSSLLQGYVEQAYFGRAMGLEQFGISVLQVGAFWAGHYADIHGVATFLAISGSVLAVFAIAIFIFTPFVRQLQ